MEIPSEETRGQHVRVSSVVMAFPQAKPARIDRQKSIVGSGVLTHPLDLQEQTHLLLSPCTCVKRRTLNRRISGCPAPPCPAPGVLLCFRADSGAQCDTGACVEPGGLEMATSTSFGQASCRSFESPVPATTANVVRLLQAGRTSAWRLRPAESLTVPSVVRSPGPTVPVSSLTGVSLTRAPPPRMSRRASLLLFARPASRRRS